MAAWLLGLACVTCLQYGQPQFSPPHHGYPAAPAYDGFSGGYMPGPSYDQYAAPPPVPDMAGTSLRLALCVLACRVWRACWSRMVWYDVACPPQVTRLSPSVSR